MCGGPSAYQRIDPDHGPLVSSPASSNCDLTITTSCYRCRQRINKETIRVPRNLQGRGALVKCNHCGKRIIMLGRESTHSSLTSQDTTRPTELTESSGTGEAHGSTSSTGNRHSLIVTATWTRDGHMPGTALEGNSPSPGAGGSAHGSLLRDGNHGAPGSTARQGLASLATSTCPPSTVRPTSNQAEVPSASQETSRPVDRRKGPGSRSRFRIRDRTRGFVSAISQRASNGYSRFRRALARNTRPPPLQSATTSVQEAESKSPVALGENVENEANVEAVNQQHPTGVSGQTRLDDAGNTREDANEPNSQPQVIAIAGSGDILAGCKCECRAYQLLARISDDIDTSLQIVSTDPSILPAGRGRSMSWHGSSQAPRNASTERFLQRDMSMGGATVTSSTEAASSYGTLTENGTAADENDSTLTHGHGGHAHQ
ncbi:hypothetical protein GP486_000554 [Trichoglossum hirsutum]|uniref:Uncharacterized protein n=1 Tax=Trichoglossum hirsutum TaxID=265104 RepID=A0A9P8LID3_9PEZI|nr:hypothetical protein GP486_000554 [Trichoglossum hirsutum]